MLYSITFFFFFFAVYENTWRYFEEPYWPRITIKYDGCALHAGYIRLHTHTLRIRNRYCFSTASILAKVRLNWRSILILSSHLCLSLLPLCFLTKTLYTPLLSPHTCYMSRPSHFLDLITRKIFVGEYRSLSFSLYSFLHSPVTSSFLGPHILLSTLFSNTLSLRSSIIVSDQVSRPYKPTSKVIVLNILIFKFFGSKLKDKRFCTEW
jgi:hypothetical protein